MEIKKYDVEAEIKKSLEQINSRIELQCRLCNAKLNYKLERMNLFFNTKHKVMYYRYVIGKDPMRMLVLASLPLVFMAAAKFLRTP